MTCLRHVSAVFTLLITWPAICHAQLAVHNTRGDYGIKTDTQAPLGVYDVGMFYDYSADTLRDGKGYSFPATPSGGLADVRAAVAGLAWTTDIKILGGNYGFAFYPAVTNNTIEFPALQTDTESSTGLADLYMQPLILGWATERADFMAGAGIYAPTGTYDADPDDNRGPSIWSYEAYAGTTFYFEEVSRWHFAATAFFESHGEKEDSDVGKPFMDGAASAGLPTTPNGKSATMVSAYRCRQVAGGQA